MASVNASNIPCLVSSLLTPTVVLHSTKQRDVKSEDIAFHTEADGYKLFAVCDGHHGAACAKFVHRRFWTLLKSYLPNITSSIKNENTFNIVSRIQSAMIAAFMEVDNEWSTHNRHSGTTMTVAVLLGRLLTVANVGDSLGYLHNGTTFASVSTDHRLDKSPSEKQRLKATGSQVAPLCASLQGPARSGEPGYGPLRVWPGGLAVARSIGDIDVTPHVLCIPHIHQILLPEAGARLVLATDGVWDILRLKSIKKAIKIKTRHECAESLCDMVRIAEGEKKSDDATITVVDILPQNAPKLDFKYVLYEQKQRRQDSTMRKIAKAVSWNSQKKKQPPLEFLANIDGMGMVPEHLRVRHHDSTLSPTPAPTQEDFTISGADRLKGVVFHD